MNPAINEATGGLVCRGGFRTYRSGGSSVPHLEPVGLVSAPRQGHPSGPTVFVVDNDPDTRQLIRLWVAHVDLNVETYALAREFLNAYAPDRPGCLLLDVRLPDMSGLELQEELATRKVEIPIIMMARQMEVSVVVGAMRAGALDFIEKPPNRQYLLERIQEAIRLDLRRRREKAERTEIGTRLRSLTRREQEVMGLMFDGLSNKEIALQLGISYKTVSIHRGRIIRKMRANSLAELFRFGIKVGWRGSSSPP